MNVERPATAAATTTRTIRQGEFIAVAALITAMSALSIDTILPAFPQIRSYLGLAKGSTEVALLVTAYLLGMGVGQIPAGVVADRFGRKGALYGFVALYVFGVAATTLAPSLPLMVLARFVWGLGGSGPRVVAIAMIRDRNEGVRMAQVLSYVQSIFVIVPVVAPSLGALALHIGGWRATVLVPSVVAVMLLVWMLRIPETLPVERRRPASWVMIRTALRTVFTHRPTLFYALSMAFLFGGLSSYISLAETIIDDVYNRKSQFPIIFGFIAASMGASTLVNARLVGRLGVTRMLRLMPPLAAGISILLAIISVRMDAHPPFPVFAIGMALLLSAQTLVTPNANTAALGPHGHLAGLASGILGTVATIGGALLGTTVSLLHNGGTSTLLVGIGVYLTCSFACIAIAQRTSSNTGQ